LWRLQPYENPDAEVMNPGNWTYELKPGNCRNRKHCIKTSRLLLLLPELWDYQVYQSRGPFQVLAISGSFESEKFPGVPQFFDY